VSIIVILLRIIIISELQSNAFINLTLIYFVTVWADNADACSLQYAGTGALKTDFTRYKISLSVKTI